MNINEMFEYISNEEKKCNRKMTSFEKTYIVTKTLNKDNAYILSNKDTSITKKEKKIFEMAVIDRLENKVPVEKIFNTANFFGYDLYVDENVLSPRNETELLVEKIIDILKNKEKNYKIIDVGTGSGCIAIALAKYFSRASVVACDISTKAINIAKRNAKTYNLSNVKFVKSDVFDNIKENNYDLIVSNPPYVRTKDISSLDDEVKRHDPLLALDGGSEGMDIYTKLIKQGKKYLKKGGYFFVETDNLTYMKILKLMYEDYYNINTYKDYNNINRIIYGQSKGKE